MLSNYSVTYVPGAFTITKATLTAVANNKTKTQGTANDGLQLRQLAHINPAVAGIRRSGSTSTHTPVPARVPCARATTPVPY